MFVLPAPLRRRSLLALVMALLGLPARGDAHAYIITSEPAQNARVDAARFVAISFDEPIALESQSPLVVRDARGADIPCAHGASLDPNDATRVVCTFAQPLPKGAYTAEWRVTSADTHVVHGTFGFGVGEAAGGSSTSRSRSIYDPSGTLATLARWLSLGGTALAFGALLLVVGVVREAVFSDALHPAVGALRRACTNLARLGAVIALGGNALGLIVQTAAATGTDALHVPAHMSEVMLGSLWGSAWCVRVGALLVVAIARRRSPVVALAASVIVLISISVAGHASAAGASVASAVLITADFVHAAGASAWAGGMAALAVGLSASFAHVEEPLRTAFVRRTIARFSTVAIASVAAILATGVVASIAHLGSLAALVETTYGRIVVAKIVLLVPLLALGFAHYRQGQDRATRADFAASVSGEAIVAFSVIGLSALLGGLAPPNLTHSPLELPHVSYIR
jgi:copper transport protein